MSLRRWLMLAALCLGGCAKEAPVAIDVTPPAPIAKNFDRLPEVLAGLPKSGAPQLFEGLPSVFWEPQLFEQELAKKKTVRHHGYPFYEEPLAHAGPDAEQLTALFAARTSFAKYTDGKKGGGFHADFCLVWTSGDATTRAIVSLEDGEVKLHGPKSELHCDFSPEAVQKLRQLLSSVRKNRPTEN